MRVLLVLVALVVFASCVFGSPVGMLEARDSILDPNQPAATVPKPPSPPTPPKSAATPEANAARLAELEKKVADNSNKIKSYYNVRQSQTTPGGDKKTSGRFAKRTPATQPVPPSPAQPSAPTPVQPSAPSSPVATPSTPSPVTPSSGPSSGPVVAPPKPPAPVTPTPPPAPVKPAYVPRCGDNGPGTCQGDYGGPCCKPIGAGASGAYYCGTC